MARPDLAITATGGDAPNGIGVFFGNGDGSFQRADTYADVGPGQLCVADMNSDGFPDLVTLDAAGFSVLLNNGKGKFSFEHSSSAGFTGLFAIGDFNNDGKPDIAIEGLGIFLGNGDGTVRAPTKAYADQTPRNLVVADVNNDHKLDVIQVYYLPSGGGIQIFYGGGNGGVVGPRAFQNDAGPLIVTGDFNNDGKIDVASVGYQNNDAVTVILGNGDGTFQLPSPGNPTSGGAPVGIATGDLNRDGKLDVAVLDSASYANSTMNIFLGNGDGTFQPAKTLVVDSGIFAEAFAVADFDRDGILDIAVINAVSCISVQCSNGTLGILIGNGDGTFHDGVTINIPSDPSVIVTADFNNDGIPDLAIGDDGKIGIFDGVGNGTFNLAGSVSVGGMPVGLLTADFNGDGNTDLGILSGVFYVTLGNGDNQFGPLLDGPRVDSLGTPIAADFNGDSIPDIVTPSGQILVGNGDGTFQPLIDLSPDAGGESVQAAVLGNDALPDIIFGSGLLNPVSVFINATK